MQFFLRLVSTSLALLVLLLGFSPAYGNAGTDENQLNSYYPDVYMTNYSCSNTTLYPGQSASIYVTQHLYPSYHPYVTPYLHYYLSDDPYLSGNDTYLGQDWSGLGNGIGYSYEYHYFQVPYLPSGTYYIIIKCDATNIVYESNEYNNIVQIPVYIAGGGYADIYMSNYHLSQTTAHPGDYVTAYVYQHIDPAYYQYVTPYIKYYFSHDPYLSGDDQYLGYDYSTLGNGDGYDYEYHSFSVPYVSPGTYYIIMKCDATDLVYETNEYNNIVYLPINITPGGMADIYMTNYWLDHTYAYPGQHVTVHLKQHMNPAYAPYAQPYVKYYLSQDHYWSNDDIYLGYDVSYLGNGVGYEYEHHTFNVPYLPPGQYYVIMKCDATNVVYETNEYNNTAYLSLHISGGGMADIYMSNYYLSNSYAHPGDYVTAYLYQHINPAYHPYVTPYVKYYFSHDPYWSSDDIYLGSDYSSLGNGDGWDLEYHSFTVPYKPPGTYYIILKCDATDLVYETNEYNNVVAMPFYISGGGGGMADIYLDYYSVSDDNVYPGQVITAFLYQFIDPSNGPYVTPYVHYYFSEDATLSQDDTFLGSDFSTLGDGDGYDYENLTFQVPYVPLGNRYVILVADATDVVNESNESNNIVTIPVMVTTTGNLTIPVEEPATLIDPADPQSLESVRLYPNPASDMIVIDGLGTEGHSVEFAMYDLSGKLVQSGHLQNREIMVSQLENGLYTIRLNTESSQKTLRVVVQH